jgi:hypothetical protein
MGSMAEDRIGGRIVNEVGEVLTLLIWDCPFSQGKLETTAGVGDNGLEELPPYKPGWCWW